MTARDALRVRRYVGATVDDLELCDEYELQRGPELAAVLDAEWAFAHHRAGRRWRIVIDDPAGDLPQRVTIDNTGTAREWQDDRDQDHEDRRDALGWKD